MKRNQLTRIRCALGQAFLLAQILGIHAQLALAAPPGERLAVDAFAERFAIASASQMRDPCLAIEVTGPADAAPLGLPVSVKVQLKNISPQPLVTTLGMDRVGGPLIVSVYRPGGAVMHWEPRRHKYSCPAVQRTETLAPGDTRHGAFELYYLPECRIFDQPGNYVILVNWRGLNGRCQASCVVSIAEPAGRDKQCAEQIKRGELERYLSLDGADILGGDLFSQRIATSDEKLGGLLDVIDCHGTSVYAPYATATILLSLKAERERSKDNPARISAELRQRLEESVLKRLPTEKDARALYAFYRYFDFIDEHLSGQCAVRARNARTTDPAVVDRMRGMVRGAHIDPRVPLLPTP